MQWDADEPCFSFSTDFELSFPDIFSEKAMMKNTQFKLSGTAVAVCLVLMQISSPVYSKIILNEKNFMTGSYTAKWNASTLTYNLPGSWYNSTNCAQTEISVELPEGTIFLPATSRVINKPLAQVAGSTSAATAQSVTIQNPLKILRWEDSTGSAGIFNMTISSKAMRAEQKIQSANIEELQLVNYSKKNGFDYNCFFKTVGSSVFNASQEIAGIEENTPIKIGTVSLVKSKTDPTPIAGQGVGFYLSTSNGADRSYSIVQKFSGTIENLGTEDGRMFVGVYSAHSQYSSPVQWTGLQEIDEIEKLFATKTGVVFNVGTGSQTQKISRIGTINVSAPDNKYRIIAGLLNHSNVWINAETLETGGQFIGLRDKVVVEGVPSATGTEPVAAGSYAKAPLVAAVVNLGGRQTITSLNEDEASQIIVGNTGDKKGFGVVVTPHFQYGNVSAGKGATVTELKGSFRVDGGDVAVLGHRFVNDVNTKSSWSLVADGGVTLKLTPTELGNRLTLGKNSNLYVSPKTAANGYTGSFLASYDAATGLGIADKNALEHFVLEAGLSDEPYVISFEEPNSYAFVDGTFKGNAVFEFKAAMEAEGSGGYALKVTKNPVVIKNVSPGSSINFLVNYDVDKGSKVAVAQEPERSVNDFAHLYLQKAENSRILVKDVANHLIIGKDAVANLSKNDLVNLALYDKVNEIGIQENVLNAANADNVGATSDRSVRGTVTINVAEGILIPAQSYVGDFYLENSVNVGVVPEAIKGINDDIRKSLYGLETNMVDPVEAAAQQAKVQSSTKIMARARTAPTDGIALYAAGVDDENKETVDTVLDSFGETVQAQTTSPTVLKAETVSAQDGVPQKSCEELGNCPKDDPADNPQDNPSQDKPSHDISPSSPLPIPDGKTSTMASLESVGIANYFIWRENTETLSQRMGEVRMTPELEGMWVRGIAGKNKYTSSGNYLSNKYYGITLGLDRNIGGAFGWTVGGSFEYIHGDGKLANSGKGKNWLGSVALYGTKQFENAGYFDVIFKASRMNNKFTAVSDQYRYISKGSYHTFGYQIGAEYGKQFFFSDSWFIEPQVQLTYGRVNSVTYKTDTGVKAKVKSVNSLIGRVGLQTGYRSENAQTFVRLSGLRDFTAKYKADYSLGPVKNQSNVSLRDSWGEVVAGTSVNFGKNVNGFAQVKRSFAAKVKQEYRADIGLRIVF